MRRLHILLILFAPLFCAQHSLAKTWYVSPKTDANGWRLNGTGSSENPWDMQTAFSGGNGAVKAGDTILVHDGEPYWGYYLMTFEGRVVHAPELYVCMLPGTEKAPVIIKAYPGEHPMIDAGRNTDPAARASDQSSGVPRFSGALVVEGSYTWVWGLEITNSNPLRENYGPDGTWGQLEESVQIRESKGDKLINLIVHDGTSTGISAFSGAIDAEIEGCIVYYCGYTALKPGGPHVPSGTYRKDGPGIYSQNTDDDAILSKKILKNNIVFEQFYNGFQIYGSSRASVSNFDIIGNTAFNNGLLSYSDSAKTQLTGEYNMLVGGGADTHDNNVSGNQCFMFTTKYSKASMKLGYNQYYTAYHYKVEDNYIGRDMDGGNFSDEPLLINNPNDFDFKHNFIYGYNFDIDITDNLLKNKTLKQSLSANFRSDSNTFIYRARVQRPHSFVNFWPINNNTKGNNTEFAIAKNTRGNSWIDSTGLDKHSLDMNIKDYAKDPARALKIIITPDDFEPGLAKIVVIDWDSLPQVQADCSHLVPAGNEYELTDVQNFFSAPLVKGNFQDNINIKMTGLKAAEPIGLKATHVMVQPVHTDARFGVFWLQYFPYNVVLRNNGKELKAVFTDINGKQVQHPPFLRYEWKKGDKKIAQADKAEIMMDTKGEYMLTITDDKNLTKTVSFTFGR